MTYPHDLQRQTEPGALELARDEVLERLGIHYAHGDLTIKELEARLELAFRSRSTASLVSSRHGVTMSPTARSTT